MKIKLFILGMIVATICYTQQNNTSTDLVKKDRTRYAKGQHEPFNGKLVKYYESGKIEAEAVLVDGKFYGPEIHYYENGNKKMQMYYRNDEPHGKIQIWNEDGKKIFDGFFKEGLLYQNDKLFTGNIECYYDNKLIHGKINYKNGKQDGEEKWWTKGGELIVEYYYGNGELLNKQVHKKNNIHLIE